MPFLHLLEQVRVSRIVVLIVLFQRIIGHIKELLARSGKPIDVLDAFSYQGSRCRNHVLVDVNRMFVKELGSPRGRVRPQIQIRNVSTLHRISRFQACCPQDCGCQIDVQGKLVVCSTPQIFGHSRIPNHKRYSQTLFVWIPLTGKSMLAMILHQKNEKWVSAVRQTTQRAFVPKRT